MQQRRLGRFGPMVPCLGFGGMSIAGAYGPTNETEALSVLERAVDLGMVHLDTADIYGMGLSEERIGTFLKTRRDRITLATKGAIRFVRATGERRIDNSPEYLRKALEDSLTRLGRDYVDIYYVHRRETGRDIAETIDALATLKREGKIRAIGLSEVSCETLRAACDVHQIAAVQCEYSLWSRGPEQGMLGASKDLGVSFVAFAPLGRGMFASDAHSPDAPKGSDFRSHNPRFSDENYLKNTAAVAQHFVAAAKERGVKPAALALAWVVSRADHIHAIPASRNVEHVEAFAEAGDIRLSDEEAGQLADGFPEGFPWGARYSQGQMLGVETD